MIETPKPIKPPGNDPKMHVFMVIVFLGGIYVLYKMTLDLFFK